MPYFVVKHKTYVSLKLPSASKRSPGRNLARGVRCDEPFSISCSRRALAIGFEITASARGSWRSSGFFCRMLVTSCQTTALEWNFKHDWRAWSSVQSKLRISGEPFAWWVNPMHWGLIFLNFGPRNESQISGISPLLSYSRRVNCKFVDIFFFNVSQYYFWDSLWASSILWNGVCTFIALIWSMERNKSFKTYHKPLVIYRRKQRS